MAATSHTFFTYQHDSLLSSFQTLVQNKMTNLKSPEENSLGLSNVRIVLSGHKKFTQQRANKCAADVSSEGKNVNMYKKAYCED